MSGSQESPRSSLEEKLASDDGLLFQLGGVTGLGWTASFIGYLLAAVDIGNGVVTRVVADPQTLLYLGGTLFCVTLGLDKLRSVLSAAWR